MNKSKCPHCGRPLGNFLYADACPHCHEKLMENTMPLVVDVIPPPPPRSWLVRAFLRVVAFVES